jgi:protein TIF31
VDSDLEQLSKKCNSDASSKTENTSSSIKSSEKATTNGVKCDGSTAEVMELPPESSQPQLAESEQATYASANNDLKGTKSYQEADVPGLYNLAMAIIDYRGHRVVAQVCIVDAILLCFSHSPSHSNSHTETHSHARTSFSRTCMHAVIIEVI